MAGNGQLCLVFLLWILCPVDAGSRMVSLKIILCILLRESEKIRFYLYLRSQDLLEEFISIIIYIEICLRIMSSVKGKGKVDRCPLTEFYFAYRKKIITRILL